MWRRRIVFLHHQHYRHRSISSSKPSSSNAKNDPLDYCIDLVRQRDRESYLCSLILPRESRLAAFAIRAFNVELASIPSMVSNPSTALMRYKFWSSTLEKIFDGDHRRTDDSKVDATVRGGGGGSSSKNIGSIPEHPVAVALSSIVHRKNLSRKYFSQLIEARIERIDQRQNIRSTKELEDFHERTIGAVLFLLLEADAVRHAQADRAASNVAKSLGLVNTIRAINLDPERNVNLLPLDLLVRHRVSQHDVVRMATIKRRDRVLVDDKQRQVESRLREMTSDLVDQAGVHLEHARKLRESDLDNASTGEDSKSRRRMFESTRSILQPAAIADHYLHVLRTVDFDLLDPKIARSFDWLPLNLWWRKFRKTF